MSTRIYFFEDYAAKDLDESLVGRKGMSLFKLKDADVPVPPFFAISPLVFDDLIYQAFGDDIEKYLKQKTLPDPIDVEKILLKAQLSPEVEEELFKSYARLSGFNDAWVAVRSSVIYLPNNKVLFSGVFATEVNVRGFEEVLKAIKKIYISMFQDSVVSYAQRHNLDLSHLRMSVVVQKMIQAEVSGVTYTKDLITQDESKLSIETVFGLGDVMANGEITPDRYVLNKKDLAFLEKRVSPQEWMHIRMLNNKGCGGVERVNISSTWSHQQKLEDRFLQEIAKICLLVEDSFGKSQNIEWVWESGKAWIIQNKFVYTPRVEVQTQTQISNVMLDPVLNVVKQKREEIIQKEAEEVVCEDKACEVQKQEHVDKKMSDLDEKIAKLSNKFEELSKKKFRQEQKLIGKVTDGINKEKKEITENISKNLMKDNLKATNFKFLASGVAVSPGVKIGKVLHIDSKNFQELKISKENVLVLKEVFPGIENYLFLAGGILMGLGGISSDLSVLCREHGVPAIFSVKDIVKALPVDSFAKIDANAGSVYIYSDEVEKEDEVNYEIVEDVKVDKKVEEKVEQFKEDLEIVPEIQKTATQVYITLKDFSKLGNYVFEDINGLMFLDLEEFLLSEGRHPLAFVEDGQFKEYTNLIAKKIDTLAEKFSESEIIVSLGNYRSKDFRKLTKGQSFEKDDEVRGLTRYLQNDELAKVVFRIIAKVRNKYSNKNVSLAFHSPLSGENMVAIKKKLSAFGLRRNSTFKIYAIIETSSEIILVEEIVDANIDGLVLNTPALAKEMQGLSLFDKKAVYDLETNSLFKTIETIYEKVKTSKVTVTGITENNKKLLEKYVELGVCGVVVDGEHIVDAKNIISQKETDVILSRSRF